MSNVGRLNHDHFHLANEVRMFDQCDSQVRIVLAAMIFAQTYNIGFVPRR